MSLLLALLVSSSAALKCWHLTQNVDQRGVRDRGLIECSPSQSAFCIYSSVTAFLSPELSHYPVQLETARCSNGLTFEETKKDRYLNLTLDNLCDGSLRLPHKWHYTHIPKNGDAYQLVERLNDVRCCSTDGCNGEDYRRIGGGMEKKMWYKQARNWFRSFLD